MTAAAHRWDSRMEGTVRLRRPDTTPRDTDGLPVVYRAANGDHTDAGLAYRVASHALDLADGLGLRVEHVVALAVWALAVAVLAVVFSVLALAWVAVSL